MMINVADIDAFAGAAGLRCGTGVAMAPGRFGQLDCSVVDPRWPVERAFFSLRELGRLLPE